MDQRSKCKNQNCRTLGRKQEKNLLDIGFGNVFLDMTPKVKARKEKKKINWTSLKKHVYSSMC